jgi:hypothetical protein
MPNIGRGFNREAAVFGLPEWQPDVTTQSEYGSAPRVLLLRPRSGTPMTPRTTTLDVEVSRHEEEIDHQRAAWMAAAQVGDRVAYERLLHDCIPLIKRVARGQGVPFDCIDDVVQETLLTVHQARQLFVLRYAERLI